MWMIVLLAVVIAAAVFIVVILYYRSKYLETSVNEVISPDSKVVLNIAVPRHNEKSPLAAEQLFASLHGIGLGRSKSTDHFSMEIAAGPYGVHFLFVVKRQYKSFFENQIYAQYPEAQITEIGDYTEGLEATAGSIEIAELVLAKDGFLPIRTFTSFDVDPIAALTGAVANLKPGHEVFIQLIARPVGDSWQEAGKKYVEGKRGGTDAEGNKVPLGSGESELLSLIETKNQKVGFNFVIRILAKSPSSDVSKQLINEVLAAYGQYKTAVLNSLTFPKGKSGWDKTKADIAASIRHFFFGKRLGEQLDTYNKFKLRYLDEFAQSVFNTEEMASIFHMPNKSVETPNISWARSKKLEFPLNLPTGGEARTLGLTDYRGINVPFGILPQDRMRHMYVIGKTGVGKSTFLENMIVADIYDGLGVGVMDPHGELIENILEMIPEHRMEDVVLFDPGDVEHPLALNLIEIQEGEDRSLIADGIVSVFKKQFGDSWGPRLEYILTNTLITLLSVQNVSLLAVPRILGDDNYRTFLLKQLKDPIMLKFWHEEYAAVARDPKRRDAEISSILNKVGRFTTNPLMRNITGQVSSSFNLKKIMDEGKILLINLSQGKIGEENMALLGGMIVTRMYSNAVRRLDKTQRTPFYLYVDEFQNFSTSTFVKILSEARKYAMGLIIAHQFIDQIDEDIRNAIFGNVGSIVNFSVGPKDAEVLIKEYTPYLEAEDLANIGKHRTVTKLSIDLTQSKPFTTRTTKPAFPVTGFGEVARDKSRATYGNPRDVVEQKIYKWAAQQYNAEGNLMTPEEIADQKRRQEEKLRKKAGMPRKYDKDGKPWEPRNQDGQGQSSGQRQGYQGGQSGGYQGSGGGQGGGGQRRYDNRSQGGQQNRDRDGNRNRDRERERKPGTPATAVQPA